MRLMVLGEGVDAAWPVHLHVDNDHHVMSRTSCSAPITAGIAAFVLDYARGFLVPSDWAKLRRIDSMRRVFSSMTNPKSRGDYWWIRHWALFRADRSKQSIQDIVTEAIS